MINNYFEKIINYLIFILVAFPFGNYVLFSILGMQVRYQLFIHILLFISIVIFSFKIRFSVINLIFVYLFIFYFFIQIFLINEVLPAIKHASVYSAFFIAVIFQAINLNLNPVNLIKSISNGLLLSLIIAIFVNIFFNNFIVNYTSGEENSIGFVEYRLYWTGALTALPVIFLCLLLKIKYSSFYVVVFTIGIIMAMNRTLYIGYIIVMMILIIKEVVKINFISVVTYASLLFSFIFIIFSLSSEIRLLFFNRLFSEGVLDVALYDTRFLIYEQYINKLNNNFNFIFGNGLGKNLSEVYENQIAYYSDVSFITFFLPLGLIGILFMFRLISVNLRHASQIKRGDLRKAFQVLCVILIFISLNIDVYSRSDLVIVFTLLLSAFRLSSIEKY